MRRITSPQSSLHVFVIFSEREAAFETFDAEYIVVKNPRDICNKFAQNQPRQRFSPPYPRPVMFAKTRRLADSCEWARRFYKYPYVCVCVSACTCRGKVGSTRRNSHMCGSDDVNRRSCSLLVREDADLLGTRKAERIYRDVCVWKM